MGKPYYLSRNESDIAKAILILLISFGHNHFLCPKGDLRNYFYLFHVIGFFILPFFYDRPAIISKDRILNTIVRNWVPYTWTVLACWVVYSLLTHDFAFGLGHVWAYINGSQSSLRNYFGFIFPWFLPAFCTFSIILMFAKKYKWFLCIVTLLGIWTFFWTKESFFEYKNIIPFGLVHAIRFFALGVITFYTCYFVKWIKYVGTAGFVVLTCLYWINPLGLPYKVLLPITFFMLVLTIIPLCNAKIMRIIGQNSLFIYLSNMFIINTLYQALPHTIVNGIITFIASVILPIVIMEFVIKKIRPLNRILFPRDWHFNV